MDGGVGPQALQTKGCAGLRPARSQLCYSPTHGMSELAQVLILWISAWSGCYGGRDERSSRACAQAGDPRVYRKPTYAGSIGAAGAQVWDECLLGDDPQ